MRLLLLLEALLELGVVLLQVFHSLLELDIFGDFFLEVLLHLLAFLQAITSFLECFGFLF
jgi:hypothetical protein